MRRALLVDLFSTLVPGGDAEHAACDRPAHRCRPDGRTGARGNKAAPDEIYLAACNVLGVAPSECVYIGDGNDKELPAAAALGMYAIRTTEHSDSDPTWTGPTVTSFTDLPNLIGAPT